jgi:hypothetical protein
MASIFHAFNISYKNIGTLAPHIREMGFTHVQFPPIQQTRILTEFDAELLLAILRSRVIYSKDYKTQLAKVYQKDNQYPPHNFHFLLDQMIQYIQSPTLQQLVSGKSPDNPSYCFFASIIETGPNHPFYPLVEAAEHVLQWEPLRPFSSEKLQELQEIRKIIQPMLKKNQTPELLQKERQLKKQISQETTKQRSWEKQTVIRQTLQELVPITEGLRQTLRSEGIHDSSSLTNIPAKKRTHVEDIVCICEVLLYPPWWMVYQPIKLEIGDTHLGTKEDILNAIQICKRYGLSVIADVVVNNLAASAGEKKSWEPVLQKAKEQSAILLSDIKMDMDIEVIHLVQDLLEGAFGSRDLSLLTAPYECREGWDPTRCWMSGCLPQLNPNHSLVREKQEVFLKSLLEAGVDGIRVDAAAHLTPKHCTWLLSFFPGLSYIEYVGPNGSMYHVRKEDFAIGEDIVGNIFSEKGQLQKTTNYGDNKLDRLEETDSVTMIVNHDQMMGTIPSAVVEHLPSQITVTLSLAYLIQRVYGIPLVLPHDIEQQFVLDALQLRRRLHEVGIVREHVDIYNHIIQIDKYDVNNNRQFVVYINMNTDRKEVAEGFLEPLSFQWFSLLSNNTRIIYNDHQNKMMKRSYSRSNRVKHSGKRRCTLKKQR